MVGQGRWASTSASWAARRRSGRPAGSWTWTVSASSWTPGCGRRGGETLGDLRVLQERLGLASPDAFVLTHAHLDHSGALPVLSRSWPDAPWIAARATADLVRILLHFVHPGVAARRGDRIAAIERIARCPVRIHPHPNHQRRTDLVRGRPPRAWEILRPGYRRGTPSA